MLHQAESFGDINSNENVAKGSQNIKFEVVRREGIVDKERKKKLVCLFCFYVRLV